MLFVPIRAAEKDSITAVFAFIDSTHISYLKIFEGNSDDTLTSDLVLHYQNTLYGKAKAGERFTKPHLGDSKEVVWVPDCYDVYTSVDHGATLNYSYTSCSYRAVYVASTTDLAFYPTGNEGNPGDGGGDDSGNTTNPNTENLNEQARNNLKNAENKLKDGPCLSETIMNSTWNNNLTIRINSSLGSMGAHYHGVIEFRSATSITDISLLHELFHEYQDNVNGVLPQSQLREFEAWLFVDLYLWDINNEALTWTRVYDPNGSLLEDYKIWIDDIYENGFNDSNMADYTKWFNEFMKVKDSTYGKYPVGTNSNPGAIINVFNVCNY